MALAFAVCHICVVGKVMLVSKICYLSPLLCDELVWGERGVSVLFDLLDACKKVSEDAIALGVIFGNRKVRA